MSQSIAGNQGDFVGGRVASATAASSPSRQAYQLLHFAFVAAPVIAGVDKFLHLLVNWDMLPGPRDREVVARGRARTDVGRWRHRDHCGTSGGI